MYISPSYERVCKYCGKEFTAHYKGKVFCSKKCKDISSKLNRGIKCNISTEPYHKECIICGKEFDSFRESQKTCSHECSLIRNNQRRRIQKIQKTCDICGKTFFTNHDSQMTCGSDKCKSEYRRIAHKKRYERAKANKKPRLITYETRECAECGEPFVINSVLNNKCCSKECKRKRDNRTRDERIPKAQRVDDISLKRLYKRDSGICYICGGKCDWNSQAISKNGNPYPGNLYPTIDHVIPISKGGLHAWDNVRLAHWKCNLDKLDGLIDVEPMSKEVAYSQKFSKTQPKRTAQYSLDGKLIRIWDSTAQIRRELGLNDKHIQNVCCRYKSNTGNAYGYHWEYVDDKNGDRQINTA